MAALYWADAIHSQEESFLLRRAPSSELTSLQQEKSMWRQGDVLIQEAGDIPNDAFERNDLVLAEGELTGHAHRIADRATAQLYQRGADLFLRVTAGRAILVHEEHGPVELDRGVYRVWRQREYAPTSMRRTRWVRD